MEQFIMLVAVFVADALVQTGAAPRPTTREEADRLVSLCASQFVRFLAANAAPPEDCDGNCESCAHCPSTGRNGSLN